MSNEYVQNEMKKVLESAEYPKNMALASAWAIAHFKGFNIKIFDVSEVSSLCDYNIIASAENTIQAKSMIDEIQASLNAAGAKKSSVEGLGDCEWILLDMGDVIVHVFQDLTRDAYDLDSLWLSSPQVTIPNEYYFGGEESDKTKSDRTDNYF